MVQMRGGEEARRRWTRPQVVPIRVAVGDLGALNGVVGELRMVTAPFARWGLFTCRS